MSMALGAQAHWPVKSPVVVRGGNGGAGKPKPPAPSSCRRPRITTLTGLGEGAEAPPSSLGIVHAAFQSYDTVLVDWDDDPYLPDAPPGPPRWPGLVRLLDAVLRRAGR